MKPRVMGRRVVAVPAVPWRSSPEPEQRGMAPPGVQGTVLLGVYRSSSSETWTALGSQPLTGFQQPQGGMSRSSRTPEVEKKDHLKVMSKSSSGLRR